MRSVRRLAVLNSHVAAQARACSGSTHGVQTPCITVTPAIGMVDEKVKIHIRGLHAGQKVTVVADLVENKMKFESWCVYEANINGEIDNFTSESLGGTFKGIEPMGLFWSLKCLSVRNQSARLVKKDVGTPMDFSIKVYAGVRDDPTVHCQPITETHVHRLYQKPGVRRIPLTGRLKGAIFVPEGKGPFPGLVDMYGGLVSIIETRAALLASHGYATMALSYLHVRDLDVFEKKGDPGFTYVKEAYEWFSEQEYVDRNRLGAVGLCYGGMLSLALAYTLPQIRVVVNINGLPVSPYDDWYNKDTWDKWPDPENLYLTDEGLVVKNVFDCDDPHPVPGWIHGAKILVIVGEDDKQTDPNTHTQFYNLCPPQYRQQIQIHRYPGAGHMIEPPYSPHMRTVTPGRQRMSAVGFVPEKYYDEDMMSGGWPDQHAYAQEDSWNKILEFLDKNLKNI